MTTTLLACTLLLGPAPAAPDAPPPEAFRIRAVLPDDLAVGAAAQLRLEVELAEPWSGASGGWPKPLLQIDVPPSVELAGKVLTTRQELARNEFLQAPFERLVEPGTTAIGFTLTRGPGPDERLGLNVLTFLGKEGGEDAWFVRRRVEVPLQAGAEASSAERGERSNWGPGAGLHVGDKAPDFELPRADGSTVRLSSVLARGGPVIVTTYRAFW